MSTDFCAQSDRFPSIPRTTSHQALSSVTHYTATERLTTGIRAHQVSAPPFAYHTSLSLSLAADLNTMSTVFHPERINGPFASIMLFRQLDRERRGQPKTVDREEHNTGRFSLYSSKGGGRVWAIIAQCSNLHIPSFCQAFNIAIIKGMRIDSPLHASKAVIKSERAMTAC